VFVHHRRDVAARTYSFHFFMTSCLGLSYITRNPWYALSQRLRKRAEEIFGWMKTGGGLHLVRIAKLVRSQSAMSPRPRGPAQWDGLLPRHK
jgi:hypothetical protein